MQKALVRAWRRRGTYVAARGEPRAWLLAIVADRARRARTRRGQPVTVPGVPADPVDPSLELAVRQLAPRQRIVVELFYYLGLPVTETAAVLGIGEGTVKSTLSDARARLRQLLEVTDA